jgi:hypothetical protein
MYSYTKMEKMWPVETIPGMEQGGIKENDVRGELNNDRL